MNKLFKKTKMKFNYYKNKYKTIKTNYNLHKKLKNFVNKFLLVIFFLKKKLGNKNYTIR